MPTFYPNFTVIHNGVVLTKGAPVEIAEKDVEALKAYGEIVVTPVEEENAVGVHAEEPKAEEKPVKSKKGKKEQAKTVEDDDIL